MIKGRGVVVGSDFIDFLDGVDRGKKRGVELFS